LVIVRQIQLRQRDGVGDLHHGHRRQTVARRLHVRCQDRAVDLVA